MKKTLRITIGSDHGGFELKSQLLPYLQHQGHNVQDAGTFNKDAVDYPTIAANVATAVSSKKADFGIMIDGAGIGSAMTCNRFPGVLAAACYNEALAKNSREHNGANVLTLGAGQNNLTDAKHIVNTFLTTDHGEPRHVRRVSMIRSYESNHMTNSKSGGAELSADDVQRIAARVQELIQSGGRSSPSSGGTSSIPLEKLPKLIDHTVLKPETTSKDIEKLCAEARKYGFYSVCVNPSYVHLAKSMLQGCDVKVCCVVGFPLGAQTTQIKSLEARKALREGAAEIDMVINIGALKSGDDKLVQRDIRGVVEDCRDSRAKCKVILETSLLSQEEKVRACELSMKAGADFVKTSTGFSTGGATVEDIALMAKVVAPKRLGVKASGGVRSYGDVIAMVNVGATRVGTSGGVSIVEEAKAMAEGRTFTPSEKKDY